MKNNKRIIASLVVSALLLVGILGAGTVMAKTDALYPPIVQKLVEKFNLDQAEVRAVFDEDREERHEKQAARQAEILDKAVDEGKITEEQKEAIMAKKAEMKQKHEELREMEPEERRAALKELREEMKAWAEANDIDLKQFAKPGHRGPGGHGGPGRRGGPGGPGGSFGHTP